MMEEVVVVVVMYGEGRVGVAFVITLVDGVATVETSGTSLGL